MPRLFVALEMPDAIKQRLTGVCAGVKGARWMRDGQFHLTLRFIGEVEPPRAREITDVLNGVRADPFELTVRGVGHFPPRGRPKMLWAGVEPSEELDLLHGRVERALAHAGIPKDRRRYAPHITLARLSGAPLPGVLGYLQDHVDLRCEPIPVTDFQLFASKLASAGAIHTVLASYPIFARSGR